jgi:hypothetical protein
MKTCNQSAGKCNSVYSYLIKVGKVMREFYVQAEFTFVLSGMLVVDILYLLDSR